MLHVESRPISIVTLGTEPGQGRVDKPNCLTPRSGADCLNLDIRRQGFGPKPWDRLETRSSFWRDEPYEALASRWISYKDHPSRRSGRMYFPTDESLRAPRLAVSQTIDRHFLVAVRWPSAISAGPGCLSL